MFPQFPEIGLIHMTGRVASPIIDLERRQLRKLWRHVHQRPAIETRHLAAGRSIPLHGDGTAGEDEVDHEGIEDFRFEVGSGLESSSIFNLKSSICNHPQSTLPPFTFRTSPVTCRARSEQRNRMGPAIS